MDLVDDQAAHRCDEVAKRRAAVKRLELLGGRDPERALRTVSLDMFVSPVSSTVRMPCSFQRLDVSLTSAARALAGNSHTAGLRSVTIERSAAISPIRVLPALVGATTMTCPGVDSTAGTAFD